MIRFDHWKTLLDVIISDKETSTGRPGAGGTAPAAGKPGQDNRVRGVDMTRVARHAWGMLAAGLITLGALAVNARADEEGADTGIPEGSIASVLPPELADPGGVRRALGAHGIVLGANYVGEVLGNTSGGIKQGTHYDGLLELYTDIDMETLIGWRGLSFHASGFQIHGTSITGENLGSLVAVSNIEAFPSTRLFELWFEQKLLDDALSIRVGQIAADAEFFVADGGGAFIASTFGWTTISSDNIPVGGPIYPMPTPGVRVAFNPNDQVSLMAGLWNGDPVGPCPDGLDPGQCNTDGFDFRLKDPPLLLVEGAYKYNQDNGGLPGTIKVGGWNHFGDFDDLRRDNAGGLLGVSGGTPLSHDGNHGVYAVLDQMIYRLPGDGDAKGISIFARVAASPSDRNQIDLYADGGFNFSGFIPGRPDDLFGIGFAYTGISDDASGFDRDSGLGVIRDYEAILELSYTAQIAPGWSLQPDVQYIWNPGGKVPDATGTRAVDNATVLGVRTTINY